MLIQFYESIFMTLFFPTMSQILPFLSHLYGTKAGLLLILFGWRIHYISLFSLGTQCTHRRGIKYATHRYISLLFTLLGKKCKSCAAQQRFYAYLVNIYKNSWYLWHDWYIPISNHIYKSHMAGQMWCSLLVYTCKSNNRMCEKLSAHKIGADNISR